MSIDVASINAECLGVFRVERITAHTFADRGATVREEIRAACQRANWMLGGPPGAAARLGLKRTALFYMMKRLGIT